MRRNAVMALAVGAALLVWSVRPATAMKTTTLPGRSRMALRVLFGQPVFHHLTLSPRAQALAFVVPSRHHQRRLVEVLDLGTLLTEGATKVEVSRPFPANTRIVALRWVSSHVLLIVMREPPPRKRIAFALLDDRGGPRGYKPIQVLPLQDRGGESRIVVSTLSSHGPVVIAWPHPGSRPVVYRYDLAMGQARELCRIPLAATSVMVGSQGWPRLVARVGPHVSSPEVLIAHGHCRSWVNITSHFRPSHLRYYDRFLALGPRGRGVYFLSPTLDPERTLGLYRLSLSTYVRTLIAANPTTDVYTSHSGRWGSLVWGRHRRRIVGVDFMPGRPRVLWLHPHDPLVRLLRGLGRDLGGEVIQVRGSSPHGGVLLLETMGDRNAGRYYLYTRKPRPSLAFLMARHPAIHEGSLAPVVPVDIPEGATGILHAYLVRPEDASPDDPRPFVILAHRGPGDERFVWFYNPLVQALAAAGYGVLAVNYHGSQGYGVRYEEEGQRNFTRVVPADLTAAARWAIDRGLTRPGEIGLIGRGGAGCAALLAAARHPHLYSSVVSIAGGGSLAPRRGGFFGRGHGYDAAIDHSPWHALLARGTAPAHRLPLLDRLRSWHGPTLFVSFDPPDHENDQHRAYLALNKLGRRILYKHVSTRGTRASRWSRALHAIVAFLADHGGVAPASQRGAPSP